jgi:hypothetical protein
MDIAKEFKQLSVKPEYGTSEFKKWIEQDDFVCFLQTIPRNTEIILYGSSYYAYVYGVLVPSRLVTPLDKKDLDDWSCNPWDSWSITINYKKGRKVSLSSSLEIERSKALARGEQIVFARRFDGRHERQSYIELSQKLTHALRLHWVPEHDAYCRFDGRGDVEDVARVVGEIGLGGVVTILRATLDEYLVATNQVVLLLYDSTRFEPKQFPGWQDHQAEYHRCEPEIYFRTGRIPEIASYLRGFQIIRPVLSMKDLIRRHGIGDTKGRQYATFIAYDWKHNVVRECSCDPKQLGNYFVESDLPYEISPVFFRPEVLQKYKADTEKYQLHDRFITCRHAWHLETYDVNDAGQVHTYLKYLSYLPYEEQLYWKSFNEEPKGPISRRAFQTDFEGKPYSEYDPLQSLRGVLLDLDSSQVSWWKLRGSNLLASVHFPVTKAADEWAKELHALDKLVTEGFVTGDLRARLTKLGRAFDKEWKSLKLLEELLRTIGSDKVKEIVEPLRELNTLRNRLSAHPSGKNAERIKVEVLKKQKTYPSHFRNLCTQCDKAIRTLRTLLGPETG